MSCDRWVNIYCALRHRHLQYIKIFNVLFCCRKTIQNAFITATPKMHVRYSSMVKCLLRSHQFRGSHLCHGIVGWALHLHIPPAAHAICSYKTCQIVTNAQQNKKKQHYMPSLQNIKVYTHQSLCTKAKNWPMAHIIIFSLSRQLLMLSIWFVTSITYITSFSCNYSALFYFVEHE